MPDTAKMIMVKVFRSAPEQNGGGSLQDFRVAASEPISVMALLAKIHDAEPGFACRTSTCFKGKCGSCLVRVNGQDVFGCVTLVKPGETITVEPHSKFGVIRDVVVDFSRAADAATTENGGQRP